VIVFTLILSPLCTPTITDCPAPRQKPAELAAVAVVVAASGTDPEATATALAVPLPTIATSPGCAVCAVVPFAGAKSSRVRTFATMGESMDIKPFGVTKLQVTVVAILKAP
jgi:nucleoid-associated protein YgaU